MDGGAAGRESLLQDEVAIRQLRRGLGDQPVDELI
jgi:hypothetical protein